ncbi:hypothetical protein AZE42_11792 [Rhizopogon vesiculosus]|uniref:Uncharacterized protein n=1 Tax=Rhizopogon vesiculosus TaxID=180088 RepID=A0A1J8QUB0_9AGAM|nr:hypothetical protein AZE42_11792 [Rhizopogon vesiculosus]
MAPRSKRNRASIANLQHARQGLNQLEYEVNKDSEGAPVLKPYVLSNIPMPLREQPASITDSDSVDMIMDDNGTTIPTSAASHYEPQDCHSPYSAFVSDCPAEDHTYLDDGKILKTKNTAVLFPCWS